MKHFTIGEIFRLGLLKTSKGTPYTSKGSVSVAVRQLEFKIEETPFGRARLIPRSEIDRYNRQWHKRS